MRNTEVVVVLESESEQLEIGVFQSQKCAHFSFLMARQKELSL